MKSPILLFILSASMAAASMGSAGAQMKAQPQPMQQPPMQPAQPATAMSGGTITLNPPNKQGPTASAQLAQQGDNVVITLHAPADETTAAVFSGSCSPNGKPQATGPATALQRLSNGTSQTTLPHSKLSDLVASPHAIVVQGGNVALLCGDVSTLTSSSKP